MPINNSIDDLIAITADSRNPPRRSMHLHRRPDRVVGLIEQVFGASRSVWYEPSGLGHFQADIALAHETRRFKLAFGVRISPRAEARGWLVETLLREEEPSLSRLVMELAEEVVNEHLSTRTGEDLEADPVRPKWDDLLFKLQTELGRSGLEVVGSIALDPTAYHREPQIIYDFDDFQVIPKGSTRAIAIPVTVTLDAPGRESEPPRLAAWYANRQDTHGSGSMRDLILQTLVSLANNSYEAQAFRRETARIAAEMQRALDMALGTQLGFHITVSVAQHAYGSDGYRYAGSFVIETPLPGSGRANAKFEVHYQSQASDELRFDAARERDRQEGLRKQEANATLTAAETAAQQEDPETWVVAVLKDHCRTALNETIGTMENAEVVRIGAVPEGNELELDAGVNRCLEALVSIVGITAGVKVHPVTDRRLHALKTGISISVEKQAYPLAINTLAPVLALKFQVFLDLPSGMQLLNPYLDEAPDTTEDFAKLKADIAERTTSIAAMKLGELSPEQYLDQTDMDNAIAAKIEETLSDTLMKEFGLSLQGKIIVTGEPDAIQERYRQIRGIRSFEMVFPVPRRDGSGSVPLRLSLTYEIDRLANPAGTTSSRDRANQDAWARFRNMALDCDSVEDHIGKFDETVQASLLTRLQEGYAEDFAAPMLRRFAPAICAYFTQAGAAFGFAVRIVESSVNVTQLDGMPMNPAGDTAILQERLKRLYADQQNDIIRRDELEFSGPPAPKALPDIFGDEDQAGDPVDELAALDDRIRRRGAKIAELETELTRVQGGPDALLPGSEGPGAPQIEHHRPGDDDHD